MTDLEKLKAWIATYEGYDILSNFHVDYTDAAPSNGGISPSGLVEIDREEDVVGNISVQNQYNFAIYCVFPKAAGDDVGATVNADWVMDFQTWAQEQSITGLAPTFGNIDTDQEQITAQNGVLFETDDSGTTGTYMVQLSVNFTKYYEVS